MKEVKSQESTREYNLKSESEQRGIAEVYVINSIEVLWKKVSPAVCELGIFEIIWLVY